MCVGAQHQQPVALREEAVGGGLHQCGAGLVEPGTHGIAEVRLGGGLLRASEGEGFLNILNTRIIQIDTHCLWFLGGVAAEEEEHLLALAPEFHDMHLAHAAQLATGEGEVYHGAGLDEEPLAAAAQQREVCQQVGRAVLEGRHLVAGGIAARGIEENSVE